MGRSKKYKESKFAKLVSYYKKQGMTDDEIILKFPKFFTDEFLENWEKSKELIEKYRKPKIKMFEIKED